MTENHHDNRTPITTVELARLGAGEVAYMRPITADEVMRLIPQVGDVPAGIDLFALLGADGTPIMISDSRDALAESAEEHHLVTVTVH